MDFLKSCTTNAYTTDDLRQTHFWRYIWEHTKADDRDDSSHSYLEIVSILRSRNILCTADGTELWIFGHGDDNITQLVEGQGLSFREIDRGIVEDALRSEYICPKPVNELLLDAIEYALAFRLAQGPGFLRVCPWTWFYSGAEDHSSPEKSNILISIHAKIDSDGTVLLIPDNSPAVVTSLQNQAILSGCRVVLAPYGQIAEVVERVEGTNADDAWTTVVLQLLSSNGLSVDRDMTWTTVSIGTQDDQKRFSWPTFLCLVISVAQAYPDDLAQLDDEWYQWFAGHEGAYRNPFVIAEEWLKDEADVTRLSSGVEQILDSERELDGTVEPSQTQDHSSTFSPSFPQHSVDQSAAPSGIYPTPPDGQTQALLSSQTSTTAISQTQQNGQGPSTMHYFPSSDDQHNMEQSLDRSISRESGHGDLFGDSTVLDFNDNDIGDADFSFFDEPDGDPLMTLMQDSAMSDVSRLATESQSAPLIEAFDNYSSLKQESDDQAADSWPRNQPDVHDNHLYVVQHDDDSKVLPPGSDCQYQPFEQRLTPPQKPLSPFGVKERILPPPIPASIAQSEPEGVDYRRGSNFSPVVFKEGFNLTSKYANNDFARSNLTLSNKKSSPPDISLPPTRKKSRRLKHLQESHEKDLDGENESEEDSFESTSSESDEGLPPRLPWDTRKRKRHTESDAVLPLTGTLERMWPDDEIGASQAGDFAQSKPIELLEIITARSQSRHVLAELGVPNSVFKASRIVQKPPSKLPNIEDLYDLSSQDLSSIAQIICDQSATSIKHDPNELTTTNAYQDSISAWNTAHALVLKAVRCVCADATVCDLSKIASIRETPTRTVSTPSKSQQAQPRHLQRTDNTTLGPDCFSIAAPFVKVQRGAENWEMLPTCLSFWEPLGLGPTSGPKNVRAFCVLPANDDLRDTAERFISDVGTAYESCKLGSHTHSRISINNSDGYENSMAPVELTDGPSRDKALLQYAATCEGLGKVMASMSELDDDRTMVVYILNPFYGTEALQHLCACFWKLFTTYRNNLPKAHKFSQSDVVLQLVPITMVASLDAFTVSKAEQMAVLAREVYDRCPPSSSRATDGSPRLSIVSAPFVELATPPPKKINFQLRSEPPSDLLLEGSVLHLACCRSSDRQWMTAAWLDTTGQNQATASFCLRGSTYADTAKNIWERTMDIIDARQVTWRIFIVTDDQVDKGFDDRLEKGFVQYWHSFAAKPRSQPLCVTFLTIQTKPILQFQSPAPPTEQGSGNNALDMGVLTPVSTPQGANFISSPDMTGHSNAPPTPAPSEPTASSAEIDTDAYLTDLMDETWAVLLSPKLSGVRYNSGLVSGALYKRGEAESIPGEALPSLEASLHWSIQVRPCGSVDETSLRQAEATLREILRMYRNLALLTKAKGLNFGSTACVPLHVALAMCGAKGIDGMLPEA